jgi:hypothetical protein
MEDLKREFLELLDKDLKFRYAIAGYLGLSEVLKRLDSIAEEQVRIREEQTKIWVEVKNLREGQNRLLEELAKLRQDMMEGFRRHDEILAMHVQEIAKLREDMIAGFKRHDEELAKLRQDMMEGFRRHDEILAMHAQEIAKLREDMIAGFKRHDEELAKLRQDMIEGFNLLKRHIDALGVRWGIMAEEAFREGLKGLIEKELGFKVERWVSYDEVGIVFGYPSRVEVDVAVKDERLVLVEISSHVKSSDVHEFRRKAELYERKTGRKPDRLIIITPYADGKALEAAGRFGIEIYTKV